MITGKKKAIFLDRDGVVNVDHGYTFEASQLELYSDLPDFLTWAKKSGFLIIVITNQSGVARGKYSLYDVLEFHRLINQQLKSAGLKQGIDAFYICPHLPEGIIPEYSLSCPCRKPGFALVTEAAQAWDLNLQESWLLGDKDSDVQCALQANVRPILVKRGSAQGFAQGDKNVANAKDLSEARHIIQSRLHQSPDQKQLLSFS